MRPERPSSRLSASSTAADRLARRPLLCGAASFQVCFDIPPKAIKGGEIFVEGSFSFSDDSRVYWRTR